MSLWGIVPVKPLNRAKSRLSTVLSAERRYELAQTMLRHVLQVTLNVPQVTGVLVISRDTKALSIARDLGARTVQESGDSDLNSALTRATEVVRVWGAEAILILPADLPFIQADDIRGLIREGMDNPSVVIAPDTLGEGTNALLVRPPGVIKYHYGPDSYQRHIAAATEAGLEAKTYSSPTLLLDVDIPHDLDQYNARVVSSGVSLPLFLPDIQFARDE